MMRADAFRDARRLPARPVGGLRPLAALRRAVRRRRAPRARDPLPAPSGPVLGDRTRAAGARLPLRAEAAIRRRRGEPDPLEGVKRLDETVLARLGIPRERLDETIVSDAVGWAATLTRVGRDDEAAALLDAAAAVDGEPRARSWRRAAACCSSGPYGTAGSPRPRASWPRTLAVDDAVRPPGELLRRGRGRRGRRALAPSCVRARGLDAWLAVGRARSGEDGVLRSGTDARGGPARSAIPACCSTSPAAARTSAFRRRTAWSTCPRARRTSSTSTTSTAATSTCARCRSSPGGSRPS